MKVHIDIDTRFSNLTPDEIRRVISSALHLLRSDPPQSPSEIFYRHRRFTEAIRGIVLVAACPDESRPTPTAQLTAVRIYKSWRRPLREDRLCARKIHLDSDDFPKWMLFSAAQRFQLINDYLAIGSLLRRGADEPNFRLLVEKVWDFWRADAESAEAWAHVNATLEVFNE